MIGKLPGDIAECALFMATDNIQSQLKSLRGQVAASIFIRIFPPHGESSLEDVDASLGFIMAGGDGQALLVSTSQDDGWSPVIVRQDPPPLRRWQDLEPRLRNWMENLQTEDVGYEYYSVEGSAIAGLQGRRIANVEVMLIDGEGDPFGVRFEIGGESFISYSSATGNSIELPGLVLGRGVAAFESLGQVVYK